MCPLTVPSFLHVISGHYFLDGDSSISISEADVNSTNASNQWTFEASLGFRIVFTFHTFGLYWSSNYYTALEIGDGNEISPATRLAHFRGLHKPDNVTSIANAAWMIVYETVSSENTSPRLHHMGSKIWSICCRIAVAILTKREERFNVDLTALCYLQDVLNNLNKVQSVWKCLSVFDQIFYDNRDGRRLVKL